LDAQGRLRLADAMPETPVTAPPIGFLREGRAKAWIVGPVESFLGAVVQSDPVPEEPLGYGTDAEALFAIIERVQGWTRVEVEGAVAGPLGKLIEDRMGLRTRLEDAIYYQLLQPVKVVRHEAVRVLTPADEALVDQAARDEFWSNGFAPVFDAVPGKVGVDAGAVVDGRVVSFVFGWEVTARYAELNSCTLKAYRRRGFAAAAGSIAAGHLQDRGFIPTRNTEAGNPAAMRVAEKLGFVEVLPRRCYVVTERFQSPAIGGR